MESKIALMERMRTEEWEIVTNMAKKRYSQKINIRSKKISIFLLLKKRKLMNFLKNLKIF